MTKDLSYSPKSTLNEEKAKYPLGEPYTAFPLLAIVIHICLLAFPKVVFGHLLCNGEGSTTRIWWEYCLLILNWWRFMYAQEPLGHMELRWLMEFWVVIDTVIPKTHPVFNSPISECIALTNVCNSSQNLLTNSLKHEVRPFTAARRSGSH